MPVVENSLPSLAEMQDALAAKLVEEQAPARFCVDCKWSKYSTTSTPIASDVRCFNPKVAQTEPGYAVLGPLFSGVNCINQRSSVGACGKAGLYYESTVTPALDNPVGPAGVSNS